MAINGDLTDEFERIVTALTTIKNDFESIRDDIATFKDLGTSCEKGIITTTSLNSYSRALLLMSIIDNGELDEIISEMNNPTSLP